jgi:hypothetical protein
MSFYSKKDLKKAARAYSKDFDRLNDSEKHLVLLEAEKWLKAFSPLLKEKMYRNG